MAGRLHLLGDYSDAAGAQLNLVEDTTAGGKIVGHCSPWFAGRSIRLYTALACLIACILPPNGSSAPALARPVSARPPGVFPLVFEPNVGQADAGVRFVAHGSGAGIPFAPDEIAIALPSAAPDQADDSGAPSVPHSPLVARLRFLGANPMQS